MLCVVLSVISDRTNRDCNPSVTDAGDVKKSQFLAEFEALKSADDRQLKHRFVSAKFKMNSKWGRILLPTAWASPNALALKQGTAAFLAFAAKHIDDALPGILQKCSVLECNLRHMAPRLLHVMIHL